MERSTKLENLRKEIYCYLDNKEVKQAFIDKVKRQVEIEQDYKKKDKTAEVYSRFDWRITYTWVMPESVGSYSRFQYRNVKLEESATGFLYWYFGQETPSTELNIETLAEIVDNIEKFIK